MTLSPKLLHSLSTRITLATFAYSLVIAIIVCSLQLLIAYRQAKQDTLKLFTQVEQSELPTLINALWNVNQEQVTRQLNAIADQDHAGWILLEATDGERLERNRDKATSMIYRQSWPLEYREGSDFFPLGTLTLEISNQQILKLLIDKMLLATITTLITILLGAGAALLLFHRWVSRNLQHMAKFTETIDLDRLDQQLRLPRAPTKHPDELDVVVHSINQLQQTLSEDLTLRKKIETELRVYQENLEELVRERTQSLHEKTHELERKNADLDAYAHSVAHDLKNPLTVIIGTCSILQLASAQLSQEQLQQQLSVIKRTGNKMSSIVEALLLLASVQRETVQSKLLDIKTIAQEACQRLELLAQEQKAQLHFTGDWLPAMGHAQWVEEVWVNYLSNAIKYGGKPPQIELGCKALANRQIKFWVRDKGAGIPPAQQADLFVQFSRLDPMAAEGHGLGLSLVKRIIEQLEGEVGYELAPEGGSVFWFSLPAIFTPDTPQTE